MQPHNLALPLVAAAWLGLGALLFAQTPTKTFHDSASVVVIEVPVEVTSGGVPVRGLTRDKFRLEVDGKSHELVGFEEVDVGGAETVATDSGAAIGGGEAPAAPATPVAARRRLLFLFDLTNASPAAITKSQEAAHSVLTELAPTDLVAVGTFSRSRGFELLLYYSPDHHQVADSLAAIGRGQPAQAKDPLRIATGWDGAVLFKNVVAVNSSRSGRTHQEFYKDLQNMIDRAQTGHDANEATVAMQQLRALGELCRSLGGRKHVVLFSAGFEDSLLTGTTDDARRTELMRTANEKGELWRVNSEEYFGSNQVVNALESTIEALRRGDCTVHTVDTSGLRAGGSATRNEKVGTTSLFAMADGTGGSYFENFNQLGQAVGKLLAETRLTYLLSFQPVGLAADGKFHKIEVKVSGLPRRTKVRHRPGFFAADGRRPALAKEQLLDLGARLLDDRRQGELSVRAAAWAWRSLENGLYHAPLVAELDAPADLKGPSPIDVFVYAFDHDGQVRDVVAQRFVYDPTAGPSGLRALLPAFLPAGRFSLRVLVREPSSGRTGLAVVPLEIDGEARALLVPEEVGFWQLARGNRQGTPEGHPFAFGTSFFSPALRPQVASGGLLPLVLVGLTAPDAARIFDLSRREVARLPLGDLVARQDPDGLERQAGAARLPALPPGAYQLEVGELRLTFEVVAGTPATRFVDVLRPAP